MINANELYIHARDLNPKPRLRFQIYWMKNHGRISHFLIPIDAEGKFKYEVSIPFYHQTSQS